MMQSLSALDGKVTMTDANGRISQHNRLMSEPLQLRRHRSKTLNQVGFGLIRNLIERFESLDHS